MQNIKAIFATLAVGSLMAALLAISPALKLAWYDSLANNASAASVSDICRTSATLLKRTERMEESSLSVPELRSTFSLSGVFTGTKVGVL